MGVQHKKTLNRNRYLGLSAALSSTTRGDSASRMSMQYAQARQTIVPNQSDIPRILTGFEKQMGNFTFGCRAPEDLQITHIISKCHVNGGEHTDSAPQLTTVIYRSMSDHNAGRYGVFHIEAYQNQLERVHELFSFKYELVEELWEGKTLRKNQPITMSPNVDKNGMYSTTLMANTVYLSMPATIEDGFIVSESLLERGNPIASSLRTTEWGRNYYPLNLYGTIDNYKPFPEVGDTIREDGLVFALRKIDNDFAGLEMTNESLLSVDYMHDRLEYGKAGAEVFDVVVETTTNEFNKRPKTPVGMEALAKRYSEQLTDYHTRIVNVYNEIQKTNHYKVTFTPMLSALVTQALGDKPNYYDKQARGAAPRRNDRDTIIKTFRATPIDEWRVTVQYAYRFKMGEGAKLSSMHGGKGVVTQILPDKDMPVDVYGNRADVAVYGKGAVARLNPGQFYEQYINACSRDITKDILTMMDAGKHDDAWAHFLKYLEIAAPQQLKLIDMDNQKEKDALLKGIYTKGIYLYIPADDPNFNIDIYRKMNAFRPPDKSVVTYTDVTGVRRTTKIPVLIGALQTAVLEKIDHKPMSASGVLRQHHGLPAVQNKSTKYSRPTKERAPRVIGESESRAMSATVGADVVANLMDLAGNPTTHRESIRSIYTADNPSNIEAVVDRTKSPINGRPAAFVKHILRCAGIELTDEEINNE